MLEWNSYRGRMSPLPVVVSYFTDAFYLREAWDLVRTLQEHALDYCVREVPDLKAWGANTNHKPKFLLERDEEFPSRPLLWLDADARVRRFPHLLEDLGKSEASMLAYHTWRGPLGRHGACSGTVFLAPGEWRRRFLRQWDVACRQAEAHVYDQESMALAAQQLGITHYELPQEYCWIYDLSTGTQRPTPDSHPVVVEHMQASRWRKRMRGVE